MFQRDTITDCSPLHMYTIAPLPPVTAPGLHPLLQPYLAVPAGLQFTAQFVEIAADILDTPLSHPLHRPLCIL